MNKYKVQFEETQRYIVDVLAENEEIAKKLATKEFDFDAWQQDGDPTLEIGMVYDVTNTDDPFDPIN